MATSEILLDVDDNGVGVLTLNRPERLNALSERMFEQDMPEMVARIEADPSIRVLILTGTGGNFCSGADIHRMRESNPLTPEQRNDWLRQTLDWVYRLANLDRPVVAAVDGVAYGGGFSVALTADIILATPRARFCLVFGRIGMVPDMASAYLLPRLIGIGRTKELAMTARSIDAAEAQAMGIVQDIHEPAGLMPAARAMARRLTHGSAVAMAEAKALIGRSLDSDQPAMIEAEIEAQYAARNTDFHREAVRRFLNREPRLYDWDTM